MNVIIAKLSLLLGLALTAPLGAARLNPEAHYQEIAAEKYNGQTEVTMPDGTGCNIVTKTHAIEVDFADKWQKVKETQMKSVTKVTQN